MKAGSSRDEAAKAWEDGEFDSKPRKIAVLYSLFAESSFEFPTECRDLALTRHKNENTAGWQSSMNFNDLFIRLRHIIIWCATIEMRCDGMLPS
jgi:hypothetical protein